jgi:hypothetical protein
MQTPLYTPLVSFTCAFKFEGHSCIIKCAKRSDKGCLDLVFYFEGNLLIPRIAVEETWKAAASCGVHNLIDLGKPERIFFAFLIKISIINTRLPIFIPFRYKNGIGEPIGVVHFFSETGV